MDPSILSPSCRNEENEEFTQVVTIPQAIARIKPVDDMQIFRALPALIDSSHSEYEPPTRPNVLDISSDSDLSIERTYNLQSGKITQKFGDIHKEVLTGAKSPEGTKYLPIVTELDNKFDENHNDDDHQNQNVPFTKESTKLNDSQSNVNVDEVDSFSLSETESLEPYYKTHHLGQFSKSCPNSLDKENVVAHNLIEFASEDNIQVENEKILPVNELRKRFEKDEAKADSNETKLSNVYSLTARSIPNQVKKELKLDAPCNVEAIQMQAEDEIIKLPSVKSRKAFFENLKQT